MSRVKNALAVTALSVTTSVVGCASTPDANADLTRAVEEATRPASEEARAAANRADPLARANFWSKEYAKQPEDVNTTLEFTTALRGIGSHDRAIEVLSQSLIVNSAHPDLLMALGRAYVTKGETLNAARAFEHAAIADPDKASAWAALGTALDKLERHSDAQEVYGKALAIEPGRTSTLANYGLSLALSGDLPGAEAKLRDAASNPDASAKVHENLALILGLQGKYEEMVAISGRHAPQSVAESNAATLRKLVQPVRQWEALVADDSVETEHRDTPVSNQTGLRLRR